MERNLTGLKRLIRAKTAIGTLPEITEYTATGNPATFSTNLIKPLQAFEIPFMPVQSGSGTPSPDNVRPISGWPGVTVTANGKTILVAWESVAGVVYGGTVDLVSGVLTVDRRLLILDGDTGWAAVGSKFYHSLTDSDFIFSNAPQLCNYYLYEKMLENGSIEVTVDKRAYLQCAYGYNRVWVYDTDLTLDTFKAMLNETPLQITYPITPKTVQLQPMEIKTIIGQNSIATNTAGTNTIKYLKRG